MPDDAPPPRRLGGRQRPRASDLAKETTEGDLWDLDDQGEGDRSVPVRPRDSESEADDEAPPAAADTPATPATPAMPVQPEPAPRDTPEPAEPAAPAEPAPSSPSAPAETTAPEPSADPSAPASEPAADKRRDLLGLALLGAVLVGLLIWGVANLARGIPTTREGDDQPEFPARGDHATVAAAETYWREPIREGENRDPARLEAVMIPALQVTLEGGDDGALRVIFRDGLDAFVGDTISRDFADGRFVGSGSPTLEFAATDGFHQLGDFNAYRVGDNNWSVEVYEGPDAEAPARDFNLLFTAPISPDRR